MVLKIEVFDGCDGCLNSHFISSAILLRNDCLYVAFFGSPNVSKHPTILIMFLMISNIYFYFVSEAPKFENHLFYFIYSFMILLKYHIKDLQMNISNFHSD